MYYAYIVTDVPGTLKVHLVYVRTDCAIVVPRNKLIKHQATTRLWSTKPSPGETHIKRLWT